MWFPRRYTFGLAVVALVAGTLPAGTAVAAESPETEGVAVAEFTIVGHKFRIPKAYLTQKGDMAGRVLDDYGDAVFMEGLMPDIRPLVTKHEKKYYRGGEPMLEVVRVGIWSREGAKWIGPDPYFFRAETLKDCAEADAGYCVCPPERPFRIETKEFFVREDLDKRLVFECTKLGSAPSPHCYIELPLIDHVELKIGFQRKYFSRKEEIIDRVYGIVCGYWVPDPDRAPAVNHCK